MIEIIKEKLEITVPVSKRRFQNIFKNNKWEVIDTHNKNITRYKGAYEDVVIACHNLNKKFYLDKLLTNREK